MTQGDDLHAGLLHGVGSHYAWPAAPYLAAAAGLLAAAWLLSHLFRRVQPSLIGLAVGMVMPIPFAVSLLIGGLAARWIRRRTGPEWFGRNRNIIVGGLAVGEGVVIGLIAAIAALRSSLIALPY